VPTWRRAGSPAGTTPFPVATPADRARTHHSRRTQSLDPRRNKARRLSPSDATRVLLHSGAISRGEAIATGDSATGEPPPTAAGVENGLIPKTRRVGSGRGPRASG
jgi:hypothetical protein